MKSFMLTSGIIFGWLLVTNTKAETTNKQQQVLDIPLKTIWGYNMPGTRDVQKIEDRRTAKQIEEIRLRLSTPPPNGKDAPTGFAVAGSAVDALREAHAVLVGGKKPREKFTAKSAISAVFFSYQSGSYVHLQQVYRKGDEIVVQFKHVPHETAVVTEHFAIVPLGRLEPGNYQVKVEMAPMDQRFIDLGFTTPDKSDVRRRVSRSFKFSVTE